MKQSRNSTGKWSALKKTTQNKAHPSENTSEITEEQMYFLLISKIAEKTDLVHETHWVDKPRQLHYDHQQKRFSECNRYEVRLCQTEQLRILWRKLKHMVQANLALR